MRALLKTLFTVVIALNSAAVSASLAVSRDQAIQELKDIKKQNSGRLNEIEGRIKALVSPASSEASLNAGLNEAEIEALSIQRQELILRQSLIDRLIFQVDTKFKGGDLRIFLSERLVDMSKADLLEAHGGNSLWKQMSYLSQTLRQIPERGENIIGFVDGYLKSSPFKKPLKPDEYLRSREYSNGGEHMAASPATKEHVGEIVEQRINEVEAPTPESEAPVILETQEQPAQTN